MLEVISVLPLLTAPVEIPTVTDLLEEKEQELHQLIEENIEQTQEELAERIQAEIDHRKWHEEQEKIREEQERQAEQARAEEARRAKERDSQAKASEQEQAHDHGLSVANDSPKWEPIARCESGYGGNPQWDLNTGNGFYGGLQFTLDSWRWVGGEGYPHHASKAEQIQRAEILLERQGWRAWPVCSQKAGYR